MKKILLACSLAASATAWAGSAPPNIVLLFADDLGVGDLASYNPESKIPTPHLDRLAAEGRRFTNAYCPDAVCTPTRYALMTGRYSWRTPRKSGVQGNWESPLIETGRTTLPGLLQQAGYQTGGFGKWHLGADFPSVDGAPIEGRGRHRHPQNGANLDLSRPLRNGPVDRGFDRWYGFICASESLVYDQNDATAFIDVYPEPLAQGGQSLQRIPLVDYLDAVTDQTVAFVEQAAVGARDGRPFFLFYSPYVPHTPLAVPDRFKGRTRAGDYGDYVHALDESIGRILAALDRAQLSENTLVLFAADNGSEFVTTGEGHRPAGILAGRKHSVLEGGVRTPLVARWPGHVAAGSSTAQLFTLVDLLATFSALTGEPLPADSGEDSWNLLEALVGPEDALPTRDAAVLKAGMHQLALRRGQWKFIALPVQPPGRHPQDTVEQLYDLVADPGETRNLAAELPALADELRAQLDALVQAPRSAPVGSGAP